MSGRRLKTILLKEWLVLSKDVNNVVLVLFLPFLVIAEPIAIVWLVQRFAGSSMLASPFFQGSLDRLREATPAVVSLSDIDQLRVFLLSQLNWIVLLIPVTVAVSFATFSIVDEKLSGSLEALLATPVRTSELLLGKALAGAVPSLFGAWLSAGAVLLVLVILGWGYLVPYVVTPAWLIALLLLTPALGLLAFLLGVIGSSRARDARGAQSLVALIIFPLLGFIALQVTGVLWFTAGSSLLLALGIAIVDAVVLRLAVRVFQRESIVLRWR